MCMVCLESFLAAASHDLIEPHNIWVYAVEAVSVEEARGANSVSLATKQWRATRDKTASGM